MKPIFEFSSFLALAFGAHLIVWHGSAAGTDAAAGQGGDGAIALSGATAALQDMVAKWDRPPQIDNVEPNLATPQRPAERAAPPVSTVPVDTAPNRPQNTPRAPEIVPMPQTAQAYVADSPPPAPKPTAKRPARPAPKKAGSSPDTTAERPKGQGNTQAAGQKGSGQTAAPKSSGAAKQMSRWGGAIRASIERRKQYPKGSRAKGSVSLSISVSSTGALTGLSIAKSSGDEVLDRAALSAVKRARLPKAPAGIDAGAHQFTLSVSFAR